MTKKLILLAGLHKTGTTSIQKACRIGYRVLFNAGFIYAPEISNDGFIQDRGNGNHSRMLRFAFRRNPMFDFELQYQNNYDSLSQKIRKDLNAKITDIKNNAPLVMIAESVSTFNQEEMERLKQWFLRRNYFIELHCFIRNPQSWINSMISQRIIGRNGPRLTLNESVAGFASAGIIRPRINSVSLVFPEAKFHSLSVALKYQNGLIGYFLQKILGLENGNILNNFQENTGASDHSVRINSEVNLRLGSKHASKENYYTQTRIMEANPTLFSIPGSKFHLRESEVAPLLPVLIEENNWLKENFGEGFYDKEIMFSNKPITLNDEERKFLIDNFSNGDELIKSIVKKYLAEH